MDFFDQINQGAADDEEIKFNVIDPSINPIIEETDIKTCTICGIDMTYRIDGFSCVQCGLFIKCAMDTEMSRDGKASYNISSGGSTSLKVVGGNKKNTRQFMRNNADYSHKQYDVTYTQMQNAVRAYSGVKIPPNIIKQAASYYHEVQQHMIIRSFNRKACMAECLYRVSLNSGLTKKPKEMVKMFGVEQKDMSNAAAILDGLHSVGLVDKFNMKGLLLNSMEDILRQYFKRLNIPDSMGLVQYKNFCVELMLFVQVKKLITDCILTTQCSGCICLLSDNCKELNISKDNINKHCNVSKSTFTKYSEQVNHLINTKEEKTKMASIRIKNIFFRNKIRTTFKS